MHWISTAWEKTGATGDRSMVQTVADMYDLTPDQLGNYSGWVKVSPEIGGCDRAVQNQTLVTGAVWTGHSSCR